MNPAQKTQKAPESLYAGIMDRTTRAYMAAESAAGNLAGCLAGNACYRAVETAEEELDCLDREVDASVAAAMAEAAPAQARELLAALKMLIDLERIGDLFASVAGYVRALRERLAPEDVRDLVNMANLVEKMLADAQNAFLTRHTDRALMVLRADSEVDRIRNLILIRHLEQAQMHGPQDSVQVLFMAQALERAGDHAKNLAEEICHLTTGKTVRHLLSTKRKADEQMYLDYLRTLHQIPTGNATPAGHKERRTRTSE